MVQGVARSAWPATGEQSRAAHRALLPSYEEFAAAYATRMYRAAYLLTGNVDDARDLTQDVLERLFVHWGRVRGHPYPYAHKTLVNLVRNRRRWARRHPEVVLDDAGDPVDLVDATGVLDARDELLRALQQLSVRQRTVLVLRYFDDLSEADTAQAMGVSTGTVKSQTFKAFARLRKILGEDADPHAGVRPRPGSPGPSSGGDHR